MISQDADLHPISCPKCGKKPMVKRTSDPAEIGKRYSVQCSDMDNCKYKKIAYGATELLAIKLWNDKVCRVAVNHTESELRYINAGR